MLLLTLRCETAVLTPDRLVVERTGTFPSFLLSGISSIPGQPDGGREGISSHKAISELLSNEVNINNRAIMGKATYYALRTNERLGLIVKQTVSWARPSL